MRTRPSLAPPAGETNGTDDFHRARSFRRRETAPIGFHVTLRLEDSRPLATTLAAIRTVARVVLVQGEKRGLLAFGTADDHVHAELATDRASAGAFALYVETSLRNRLGIAARLEPARIRPLRDQKHAYNTFHYVHRQDERHELERDLTREGTSLPDLLGLRVLPTSLVARVRTHLPRVRRDDLIGQLPRGTVDASAKTDLSLLVDAACAVFALPELRGQSVDVARARRAAVHVAGPNVRSEHLADFLGVGRRSVQLLRSMPPEPHVLHAVEAQVRLRALTRIAAADSLESPIGQSLDASRQSARRGRFDLG